MKKMFLILAFMVFNVSAGSLFAQFQGTLEIKETTREGYADEQDESSIEFLKEHIRLLEEQLAGMKNTDEGYEDLLEDIMDSKEDLADLEPSEPTIKYSKMLFLGSNVRIEETDKDPAASPIFIMKSNEKRIIILMPEEKQYMDFDFQAVTDLFTGFVDIFKDLAAAFDDDDDKTEQLGNSKANKSKTNDPQSNVNKTGKSTTLHGYKCQEYVYSNEESVSTAWICENFSDFWKIFSEITALFDNINMTDSEGSSSKSWFVNAMETNGFPFKITEKTTGGELISEWEVINVNKSKPVSNLFEIPKDYKKVDIMEMFGK